MVDGKHAHSIGCRDPLLPSTKANHTHTTSVSPVGPLGKICLQDASDDGSALLRSAHCCDEQTTCTSDWHLSWGTRIGVETLSTAAREAA